jgi:hypothetical protein
LPFGLVGSGLTQKSNYDILPFCVGMAQKSNHRFPVALGVIRNNWNPSLIFQTVEENYLCLLLALLANQVLVPFQGLLVLMLIVAWDIPGSRYEIFFSIQTIKLVVVAFVKYVVIIWSVNIWSEKSIKKPPDNSRASFSRRPTSKLIIVKDNLRTEFETCLFVWLSKLIVELFLGRIMLVRSIGF